MDALQIILDLARQNAQHISVLNHELGAVEADIAIIKWFMGVNITAWIGILAAFIWKQITKK